MKGKMYLVGAAPVTDLEGIQLCTVWLKGEEPPQETEKELPESRKDTRSVAHSRCRLLGGRVRQGLA